jgi:hypothetical protein
MNKVGLLLRELHDAETDLAEEYRRVSERQASEHDVFYMCKTLAKQVDEHIHALAQLAPRFDADLDEPSDEGRVGAALSTLRHKTSELLGRRPEAGLLLLQDLRRLYLLAEEVNLGWIATGQGAQALRDHDLLDQVSLLHKQTLTQIKWIKTRLREATPQVLCT